MKVCFVALILAAVASAGNVDYRICGGVGTFAGLRIDGCEGPTCRMIPGTPYGCEAEIYPSAPATSLTLRVFATFNGFPVQIINAVLQNSPVQPGIMYTVRFTLTSNDLTVCQAPLIQIQVSQTESGLVFTCAEFNTYTNCLN